jgi:DNA-binding transcriptional LysR family regulator
MDKFEAMRVFIEVAQSGSFVAASRNLDISPPAVTRVIAQLEHNIGVRLFNRTTRQVRLTESGERYREDVIRILEEVEQAEAAAAGIFGKPQGTLTITAPVQFGQLHVTPIITDYLNENPAINIKALFFDRVSSLLEEGVDIAIRIGELKDSNLYAKKVGSVSQVLCASPAYLKRTGQPTAPADLKEHTLIQTSTVETSGYWHFHTPTGKQSIRIEPRLYCSEVGAAVRAAVNGFGITRLMSYQIGEQLSNGTLERLLPDYEPEPVPVSIIYLAGRNANAKVRSFIDFASERLKENRFIQH